MEQAHGGNRQNFGGFIRAMSLLRNIASGLGLLFRREQVEHESDEELRSFLEMAVIEKMKEGLCPQEAARAVRLERGSLEVTREVVRTAGWESFIETCWQDLRFGTRMLCKSPGFTVVAVLTLALGIGANVAIFNLMNAVLLRNLPVESPSQLVLFGAGRQGGVTNDLPNGSTQLFSYPFYRYVQRNNGVFSNVTAISSMSGEVHGTVSENTEVEAINAQLVAGTYFSLLGVHPILGRTLTDEDDRAPGSGPVAVASYAWWQRRFGGDTSIVDKKMTVDSTVYTIVGVTPRDFLGTTVGESPDVWIPLSMEEVLPPGWKGLDDELFQSLYIIARRRPGVSVEEAQANVNLLFKQVVREIAGSQPTKKQLDDIQHAVVALTPAAAGLSRLRVQFSKPLRVLMAAVGMVLLIACINIANLLLARATKRQREIAVRISIGAGRSRVVRQLLTESFLLAVLGALFGVAFSVWSSKILLLMVSTGPRTLPLDVAPDSHVLLFTFLLSLATPVLFGLIPAWRATRVELNGSLKDIRSPAPSHNPLVKSLIVSQIALSLVLLIGAGLFIRTLANLTNVDTGFHKNGVLLFSIEPASAGYKEDLRLARLYNQIEGRASAIPGVHAAAFSMFTFNQGEWSDDAWAPDESPDAKNNREVLYNRVGPGFFSTMGLTLMTGRTFGPQDTPTSSKVAVINDTLAKRFFPNESPLGRTFRLGGPNAQADNDKMVVGVVNDAKYMGLNERPWPVAYFPYSQDIEYLWDFEVRFTGDPRLTIAGVRQVIHEVDPTLPVSSAGTLSEQVDDSLVHQRLTAQLSTVFGLVAVLLACIGIYGLTSHSVLHRTHEIGIRMALGAHRRQILALIMREGFVLAAVGVALGMGFGFLFTRFLRTLLFGVEPLDPATFIVVAVLLGLIALAACYIPARRAMRVDPMVALRHE
ncbi:MAG: ABC transporter permease [Candidatus Acidiferrum sp.]